MYARIREEGFTHSHIKACASALFDGIGPRLTGSPNLAKANAWTRDQLTAMGCANAHLESWGRVWHGLAANPYSGGHGDAGYCSFYSAGDAVVARHPGDCIGGRYRGAMTRGRKRLRGVEGEPGRQNHPLWKITDDKSPSRASPSAL
jgi:hypothetical protein